ncbi:MAG: hypothetical protein MJ025_03535, partial [Victivallaceae bacterium]|nr:hypothetical protein [Victivallaceae bacterium]
RRVKLTGEGNGPLSAVVHAIRETGTFGFFKLEDFSERTLGKDADAHAMAFVGLRCSEGSAKLTYAAGEHTNIDRAAVMALVGAMNRAVAHGVLEVK